jgi:hypothetical protein
VTEPPELAEFKARLDWLRILYLSFKKDSDTFAYKVQIRGGSLVSGAESTLRAAPAEEGVRTILRADEEEDLLMNIAILVVLRAQWESYVEKAYDKFDIDVKEIIYVRDCFVHVRGKVSKNYLNFLSKNPSKNPKGYKLGDKIILEQPDLEGYFRAMENSFLKYLTKKAQVGS